jgi:hypothetical protein
VAELQALKVRLLASPVLALPQLNYRQRLLELQTLEEEVEAHTHRKMALKIIHLCLAEQVARVL